MSTFKNKNSSRTIEAQIVQKLKNNEARPKFTGSYKKKSMQLYNYIAKFVKGTLNNRFTAKLVSVRKGTSFLQQ